jgi:hypothetical protein
MAVENAEALGGCFQLQRSTMDTKLYVQIQSSTTIISNGVLLPNTSTPSFAKWVAGAEG